MSLTLLTLPCLLPLLVCNMSRKAYADLVARLHIAEVHMEKKRREEW